MWNEILPIFGRKLCLRRVPWHLYITITILASSQSVSVRKWRSNKFGINGHVCVCVNDLDYPLYQCAPKLPPYISTKIGPQEIIVFATGLYEKEVFQVSQQNNEWNRYLSFVSRAPNQLLTHDRYQNNFTNFRILIIRLNERNGSVERNRFGISSRSVLFETQTGILEQSCKLIKISRKQLMERVSDGKYAVTAYHHDNNGCRTIFCTHFGF